jgi:hypothetical protein
MFCGRRSRVEKTTKVWRRRILLTQNIKKKVNIVKLHAFDKEKYWSLVKTRTKPSQHCKTKKTHTLETKQKKDVKVQASLNMKKMKKLNVKCQDAACLMETKRTMKLRRSLKGIIKDDALPSHRVKPT